MFPCLMIYFEYYFHLYVYGEITFAIVYPCLFGCALGLVVAMCTCIFPKIGNAIISYAFVFVITMMYLSQILYHDIFATFYGVTSIAGARDAMDFKNELFAAMKNNIGCEIGMLLPMLVLILLGVYVVDFSRPRRKSNVIGTACTILVVVGSVISLNLGGGGTFSPYNLFHGTYVMELSMNKLGVAVTMGRDVGTVFFSKNQIVDKDFDENYVTIDEINEYGFQPQVDDSLDWKGLYEKADNKDLKTIISYISNKEPTYKNEYTGMFEGYNLVFITAESLSPYIVREDWTPTLYKMMHEGFVFENYYNPTWYKSTIDGEYVNCLSQYPSSSKWSLYDSSSTYQPYAVGNALNKEGYKSKAYHDYDFKYYDRSKTHINLGYDFKAIGYGLKLPSEDKYCSDLEMMETTYDDFAEEEPFNVYFMTYSGHLPYAYNENGIALKNRQRAEELTEGLPYNDTVRAYIASQLELEYALEFLIDKLESDGKLEHTLFVISPDHYPYIMHDGNYNVLAQQDVLKNEFTNYHSCLGIWCSSMDTPVVVDKICSSVDILPTVLNLMGVKYDSRILAGRDILYDEEGYAVFADYSYITPYICYDAKKGDVLYSEDVDDEEKMTLMNVNKTEQMYYISDKMLETDFYRYIYMDSD